MPGAPGISGLGNRTFGAARLQSSSMRGRSTTAMPAAVTTEQIWGEIERHIFGILAYVTPRQAARSAGIVYIVREHQLYIATRRNSWKARHISSNSHVSMTIPVVKRIPFLPWIRIPSATITFQAEASLLDADTVSPEIFHALLRGLEADSETVATTIIIRLRPRGDFLTYGVGVPLLTMRKTEQARGRAPVQTPQGTLSHDHLRSLWTSSMT